MSLPKDQNDLPKIKWWQDLFAPGCGLIALGAGLFALGSRQDLVSAADGIRLFRYALGIAKVSGPVLAAGGILLIIYKLYSHVHLRLMEAGQLRAKLRALEAQREWRDGERAVAAIDRARVLWTTPNDNPPPDRSYEDDPVYLQITLDASLRRILSQPIVQRLNHIRQLSFAYLAFGSATHTRLAHCLGACRNAELVMMKVFQEDRLYTRNGVERITLSDGEKRRLIRLAKVAALLHDLGHGPLSHGLETHIGVAMRANKPTKPDKELSVKYIKEHLSKVLTDGSIDANEVIALMQEDRFGLSPWLHFVADLIDSPLDVDRMDYLVRDAHMTGLSIGGLNIQALIERAVAFKEVENSQTSRIELAFDFSALPYIEQFLYARDVMYLNCYEHIKKVCAESMLGRAFEDFRCSSSPQKGISPEAVALLTDNEFMELLLDCTGPATVSFRMAQMLMRGITFECVKELPIKIELRDPNNPDPSDFDRLPPRVQLWAKSVMDEDYESAYLVTPEDWARDLARLAGWIEQSQILVTVPSLSIVNKWAKEGEIRLLKGEPDGGYSVTYVRDLPNTIWRDFVAALARARLKIRVFADPELNSEQKAQIRELSERFFGL